MNVFQAAKFLALIVTILLGLDPNQGFTQTVEEEPLIPQNLLKLIHTPEVQRELGLEDD